MLSGVLGEEKWNGIPVRLQIGLIAKKVKNGPLIQD